MLSAYSYNSHVQTPTDIANNKRAKKLVSYLLPSAKVHNQYIQCSKKYCQSLESLSVGKAGFPLKKIELLSSDLFHRKYLVGFVSSNWLHQMAPGCNAIATPCLEFGSLKSPPIVLVAAKAIPNKNSKLHSIIEHEFVHINQVLNGRFPSNFKNSKIDLVAQFTQYVYAEYEANFLQLEFWPKLRPPKKFGFELKEWCFLRGYTQALEQFLLAGILGNFSEQKLFSALDKIPKSLEKFLSNLDLETEINLRFIKKLKIFSLQASQMVVQPGNLTPSQHRAYEKILKWVEPDLKPQPK